jgi:hypothetical protein
LAYRTTKSQDTRLPSGVEVRDITETPTSTNWAGAVAGPPETNFYAAIGSLKVLTPTLQAGMANLSKESWSGAAWVGIESFEKSDVVLFQAGTKWTVSNLVNNGKSTDKTSFES